MVPAFRRRRIPHTVVCLHGSTAPPCRCGVNELIPPIGILHLGYFVHVKELRHREGVASISFAPAPAHVRGEACCVQTVRLREDVRIDGEDVPECVIIEGFDRCRRRIEWLC